MIKSNFPKQFNLLAEEIHNLAIEKGWWDKERNDGELLALIHSELSKCLEFLRQGNPSDDKIPDFCGGVAELADTVIRCIDMAVAREWDLGSAILHKHEYNKTREVRHGGKLF